MTRHILVFILASAACAPPARPPATAGKATPSFVYPEQSWESIDRPESVGWSSSGLEQVRQKLSTMSTTGFMAVVGGRVLMQYGNIDTVSYLASVRKSVLSMLYGIYQERGKVDLTRTLEQLGIDDLGGLTREEKQ